MIFNKCKNPDIFAFLYFKGYQKYMNGFLIAGTNSGCGKTTITIGLMALFQKNGFKVTPFKAGPDYIDPLFHKFVTNTPSCNLDSFMLHEDVVRHLFYKHTIQKDIAIIEGVMGMYDGLGEQSTGSSYELARILGLPVILVVNCKSLYQSVAAIIKGFSTLKADSNIKGVILNHIHAKEHYEFLKTVIKNECGIDCMGYLPPNEEFNLESRHLGLIQAEEVDYLNTKIELLIQALEQTIDLEALLKASSIEPVNGNFTAPDINLEGLKLGVAYDKAFRFYYHDNLELLESLGVQLLYFSPLKDNALPEGCNALYIGGGYPEVFAEELSINATLLDQIKTFSNQGYPVYAECGGLMYLSDSIILQNGQSYKMCGVFDFSVQMTERLNHFGYADLQYNNATGKCHEFHRSKVINEHPGHTKEFLVTKPETGKQWTCGYYKNKTLAGYPHLHFYTDPVLAGQIFDLLKSGI